MSDAASAPKANKAPAKKVAKKSARRDEDEAPAAKRRPLAHANDEAWRKAYVTHTTAMNKLAEATSKIGELTEENMRDLRSQRDALVGEIEDARAMRDVVLAEIEDEKNLKKRDFEKERLVERADWEREKSIRDADEERDAAQRRRALEDELKRRREEADIEHANALARNREEAVEAWAKEQKLAVVEKERIDELEGEIEELREEMERRVKEANAAAADDKDKSMERQKMELTLQHEKAMAKAEAAADAVETRVKMYEGQIQDLKAQLTAATQLTERVAASAASASKQAPVYVDGEASGRRRG